MTDMESILAAAINELSDIAGATKIVVASVSEEDITEAYKMLGELLGITTQETEEKEEEPTVTMEELGYKQDKNGNWRDARGRFVKIDK